MIKRHFCPGDEWLYYKVYTGVKTTDIILSEKIKPIIEELKSMGIIQKWFFIRYKDPDTHFRIRFFINNPANNAIVISKMYMVFNKLLSQDVIWKVQIDTYQRELERYGNNTIEETESLFWIDSEMMIEYISLKRKFKSSDTELIFSFLAVDRLLNIFFLNNIDKLSIMKDLQISYKNEFEADKILKKKINENYRNYAPKIENVLSGMNQEKYSEIVNVLNSKEIRTAKIVPIILGKLQMPLSAFLKSHIHMMLNRQYTSKQRMYECLIYDHLYRYYQKIENISGNVPNV